MAKSSLFLSQISDGACQLGEVDQARFDATLKLNAFLFSNLQIGVTDILSNEFFYRMFSDKEVAHAWLSREAGSLLRPILHSGDSFEDVAQKMIEGKTIISLSKPKRLMLYAKALDRTKPVFANLTGEFRGEFFRLVTRTVASLVNAGTCPVDKSKLTSIARWLEREGGPDLYQSRFWEFVDTAVARQSERVFLKRLSDTCYYCAQGAVLDMSHLSVGSHRADILQTIVNPPIVEDRLAIGSRVSKVTSDLNGNALLSLSFCDVATLRSHSAFEHLRNEMHRLTKSKVGPDALKEAINACIGPLAELTGKRRANHPILEEIRAGAKEEARKIHIEFATAGGFLAGAVGLKFAAPSLFGQEMPDMVTLLGSAVSLFGLLKAVRPSRALALNYEFAQRYAEILEDRYAAAADSNCRFPSPNRDGLQ